MVSVQITILLATFVVSLFSLTGILALSLRDETLHKILFFLIAFSAGTILGAALFNLLPEAVEHIEGSVAYVYIAMGFVAFYFLERFIYWYHGHGHHNDIKGYSEDRSTGFRVSERPGRRYP
jgi:zinc and cadmium transporter